jgi:hypothetical protein
MPFEERTVERASAFAISDTDSLTTCSAEDLVVHKVFAGRDKDWLDVQSIVTRQGRSLDAQLIWTELLPLLELRDDSTSEARLQTILSARA